MVSGGVDGFGVVVAEKGGEENDGEERDQEKEMSSSSAPLVHCLMERKQRRRVESLCFSLGFWERAMN